ncbi:MAG: SCO family protein [Gemmataceae bacterium]
MKKLVVVIVLIGLGVGGMVASQALVPARPARAVNDADLKKLFKPRMGTQLPLDATFRDETGKAVTLGDYGHDRPFILVPVYLRCPTLCNEVLNELVKGLRGIATLTVGREYDVVVVSFDAREKPELAAAKKEAYVEEYARRGSEPGWHFLTGEQPQIDRLLDSVGYRVVWDEAKQQFAHASGILICTPEGTLARYFPGLDYRPLYLRLALAEAGQGTITPGVIDQVLLPCFVFDATKGQYSAQVLTIVKGAGVLTALAVLVFWLATGFRRPATAPPSLEQPIAVAAAKSWNN